MKTYEEELRAENQRLWDLARHQRSELLAAGLLTFDEYDALAADTPARSRLETYDSLRKEIARLHVQLRTETEKLENENAEDFSEILDHSFLVAKVRNVTRHVLDGKKIRLECEFDALIDDVRSLATLTVEDSPALKTNRFLKTELGKLRAAFDRIATVIQGAYVNGQLPRPPYAELADLIIAECSSKRAAAYEQGKRADAAELRLRAANHLEWRVVHADGVGMHRCKDEGEADEWIFGCGARWRKQSRTTGIAPSAWSAASPQPESGKQTDTNARQNILSLFSRASESTLFYDDIAEKLGLTLQRAVETCNQLESEGLIGELKSKPESRKQ